MPVPDEAIWKMIDAAIRAPSGGNTQPWAWLVISDPAKKQALADAVREGLGDLDKALEAAGSFRQNRSAACAGPR